jgi:hypothetical protein
MKAFALGLLLLFSCLSQVAHAQEKIITGPARIREDGKLPLYEGSTWLDVSDGTNSFKKLWSHPPAQLTPNRTYTFVVFFDAVEGTSVEKILEGDRIIYDLSLCELHQVHMTREEVPMVYVKRGGPGQYYPDARGEQPSLETRKQLFPNYVQVVVGWCVIWGEHTHLYRCPICKAAFTQWEAQHATPPQ